jgi:predicted O-methyltransferase YrrM
MRKILVTLLISSPILIFGWAMQSPQTPPALPASELDTNVRQFLESRRGTWRDMNVSASDGQILYNIIVERKYKSGLEIGTSTGHSGTWIGWALAKNGGKLITIDIDRDRHEEAVANFKAAGLAKYIDARLGDAHALVPALAGPFDFVFSDADKDWYKNYLEAVLPKLTVGGCFVSHNISERGYESGYSRIFLQYARSLPFLETTIVGSGNSGMSVTYKKAEGPLKKP